MAERVIIMGAAGRDFHNFITCFRDNPRYEVVAFSHAQISGIEGRSFPKALAGRLYGSDIPIYPEDRLEAVISELKVDRVIFSYSDVSFQHVMHVASTVSAAGAGFTLLSAEDTMLVSKKCVVSVCAVRTGCGKSQTTRRVCSLLRGWGYRVVAVRHPMPYGDLESQIVQRFSGYDDLKTEKCTIEEREEFEPLLEMGVTVYAGVDYGQILERAEREADVIVWDGGNNDTPFFRPDVHIVIFDPHRAGHELSYYPGTTNMMMAHIAVINKVDTASDSDVKRVRCNIKKYAPGAEIVEAESEIILDDPDMIRGSRVLVVEDGPTLTHGEMSFGAGFIAAGKYGASEIIDPRPFATGSLSRMFEKYPQIKKVLPAVGYNREQIGELEQTINNSDCDLVLFATPVDLSKIISINKKSMRVCYKYSDHGSPVLSDILKYKIEEVSGRKGGDGS